MSIYCVFFFFSSRRRHTRWNCDWSSDVCSSDLEDLQDQPGAVEHLGVPGALQIALLDRRDRAIHDREIDLEAFDDPGDLLDFALSEIGRRTDFGDRHEACLDHLKIDGARESD